MAPLNRTVPYAGSPSCSVLVGDDLDFHVARVWHKLLDENRGITESLVGFGPRALESFGEVACGVYAANPAAAAPSRGFNKNGIAETLRVRHGIGECLYGTATPGSYRYLDFLGEELGGNFVSEPPHHISVGTNEYNAHLAAKVREASVFGHKAPPNPNGIRMGDPQCPL